MYYLQVDPSRLNEKKHHSAFVLWWREKNLLHFMDLLAIL